MNLNVRSFTWLYSTLLALALSASASLAQCGILLQDNAPPSDGSGHRTLFEWDFDGPGPLEPELLMGSDAGRVMAFNGSRWRQVGARLSGMLWGATTTDPIAFKFLNFRNELYVVAAGGFSNSSGGLFRWNGSAWMPIPMTGNGCTGQAASGWFVGGTVWNDRIVVVGQGLRCGVTTTMALTWNGTSWSPLGNLYTTSPSSAVAGSVFATSDGRLLMGGTIPVTGGIAIIAELVDGVWTTRANGNGGTGGIVTSNFQEIDGQLFALTSSALVQGQGNIPVGVLRENPQTRVWTAWHIATDANNAATSGSQLTKVGNTWYLAASRDSNQGMVLRREGEGPWTRCDQYGSYPGRMRGIAHYKNSLLAIGSSASGGNCDRDSMVYQATFSEPISFYLLPSRFAVQRTSAVQQIGAIYDSPAGLFGWMTPQTPGGNMYTVRTPQTAAFQCGFAISSVNRFDGADWRSTTEPLNGTIRSMITYNGDILGFGSFTSTGPRQLTSNVARWDNDRWESFTAGINGGVFSSILHQGELLVTANGSSGTNVFRWTGSAWSQYASSIPLASAVLVSTGTDLYAYAVNNSSFYRLEGTTWIYIPNPGQPYSDAVAHEGELYISLSNSSNFPVRRLANNNWLNFGTFPPSSIVRSLAWHQGEFYAGMQFPTSTGIAPLMIYRNGAWVPAIPTTPPRLNLAHPPVTILDMYSTGDVLHLAGNFSYIGGHTAESWIRFYTGAPRILTLPAPSSIATGQTAYFSIEPEVYHDPAQTYQWHRDGEPLADGPTGSGSTISGAATPYLRILNATLEDSNQYFITITNNCGQTTSSSAQLTISPPYCAADFNQDGGIDDEDIQAFFVSWESGLLDADVNLDGGIDGDDVQAFFILWEAGGC